tara:strand:+ start:48 stop:1064 length:1017 start_codon:yes stop_codon:yes gene_type:complete
MHTTGDPIPSIFLGAPDADQALSVQPGHRLLFQGKGFEAVYLTVIGSLLAVLSIILITPIFFLIISKTYSSIVNFIPFILILAALFLIIKEPKSKFYAIFIFFLSGILGLITTSSNTAQPLLPLLSGLFGISALIYGLFNKIKIPKQIITFPKLKKSEILSPLILGATSSIFMGFLPALGASQAATISASIKELKTKSFLIMMGSINTFVMIISFIALYLIDKTRSGSVVAISELLETITFNHLILFIAITLIAAGVAAIITIKIAKIFTKIINKINYRILSIIIIFIIIALTIVINGFSSLLILFTATSIGLIPHIKGIRKIYLMGSLMLPTILFLI